MDYSYPISIDWSTEDIIKVVQFFEAIEKVYTQGMKRQTLMEKYRLFKEVIPSIGEEKRVFREFEEASGFSSYKAVKMMKEKSDDVIIRI